MLRKERKRAAGVSQWASRGSTHHTERLRRTHAVHAHGTQPWRLVDQVNNTHELDRVSGNDPGNAQREGFGLSRQELQQYRDLIDVGDGLSKKKSASVSVSTATLRACQWYSSSRLRP